MRNNAFVISVLAITTWVCTALTPSGSMYGQLPGPQIDVQRLVVHPQGEAVPALRHRLMPPVAELQPGNAALFYYRATLLLPPPGVARLENQLVRELVELPLDQWPLEEIRRELRPYHRALMELRRGVQSDHCDWGVRWDGLDWEEAFNVPAELADARRLARVLEIKAKLEIAERRFDAALETLQQGFRLAYDVGKSPSPINALVSIAIVGIFEGAVIEFIRAPEAPNLYWGLAGLPRPITDLCAPIESESRRMRIVFPILHDPQFKGFGAERWQQAFAESLHRVHGMGRGDQPLEPGFAEQLFAAATITQVYPTAKQWLLNQPFDLHTLDAQTIEAMPAGQVVAIYAQRLFQQHLDNAAKWCRVPFWQAHEAIEQTFRGPSPEMSTGSPYLDEITRMVYPYSAQLLRASSRVQRNLVALQAIEAIRLYAAEHGHFPPALDAPGVLPIPPDPWTGRPLVYRVEDGTAYFELLAPDDVPRPAQLRVFQLQLAE